LKLWELLIAPRQIPVAGAKISPPFPFRARNPITK
jgi:hypothetical protein